MTGISKSYGTRRALVSIEFAVKPGEKVAIIGPSGSGKTTLLRIIAGMIGSSQGDVEVFGHGVAGMARTDRAAAVGMMQQRLDLVPQVSVQRNVEVGNLGSWSLVRSVVGLLLPVRDQRASEIIGHVGLAEYAHERTSQLSGGQQQRVALARLLVQGPDLMLVDEPVSSLDPALAEKMLELLCSARSATESRPTTLIASLHSPELATRFFDRVIGIAAGQIVLDKPAPEVTSGDIRLAYEVVDEPTEPSALAAKAPHQAVWGRD